LYGAVSPEVAALTASNHVWLKIRPISCSRRAQTAHSRPALPAHSRTGLGRTQILVLFPCEPTVHTVIPSHKKRVWDSSQILTSLWGNEKEAHRTRTGGVSTALVSAIAAHLKSLLRGDQNRAGARSWGLRGAGREFPRICMTTRALATRPQSSSRLEANATLHTS
jgi:hypothetical protein